MQNIQALILAAGKSTRFKTGRSKLLQKICGQEMILYSTKLLESLYIPSTIVVGYQKEEIIDVLHANMHTPFNIVVQEEQRGTGHAVACTQSAWHAESILIINADVPLLTEQIIQDLYKKHQEQRASISFVITHSEDPFDHRGRVIKTDTHYSIVEHADFTGDVSEYPWVNAGVYLIRREFLDTYISKLDQSNNKKEFYLTDLVKMAADNKLKVETLVAPFDAVRGVNNFQELWAVEHIKRSELIHHWMMHGVRFNAPASVHIDLQVSIGAGTEIGAGVQLRNQTQIGNDCIIGDYSVIEQSKLSDRAYIKPFTYITESHIDNNAEVGPFAHIRNHAIIGSHTIIGNFVEVKKSIIGSYTKAKHLSYLGDAQIGDKVNIGAGTITCNHNGVKRNTTTIHDGAYIGSNNSLVAPVTIGKHSYTAAGSTITKDVPADALAIGRAQQVNKENYASKLRERNNTSLSEDAKDAHNVLPFIAAVRTSDI